MAKLAIDKNGKEWIFDQDDSRGDGNHYNFIELPSGSIKLLIGRQLNPKDEPVELLKK